ncbi:MAG: S16 family serine protease, partial [Nitrosomonas sp.]
AERAGLRTVLLPARNQKDLRDLPEATRVAMQFILLETADDAIQAALRHAGAHASASEFKLV